ncbi:ParB/RepB/Spo0J family partition protein [Oenococcus sicerae]|uniref:ParB/RepB/Spo0J family partition protein n=1 Tax=Oenococcus sicerae TaxID=2203724 RepID=A0AAJ1RC81_9LACO|nr:ParB/RepB/Spo0J family partition protein [Oenococcus sicerae]MDN6900087.1 ParB/RepB/Spo0J family partition protein [Oenococcus sicerae]
MANKRGLGRGMDALFSDEADKKEAQVVDKVADKKDQDNVVLKIAITSLEANPFQPRKTFDQAALSELADSLKESGLIQPIVVRKHGDKYQIVAGERRFRAARSAELTQVPVIVKSLSDNAMMALSIIENLQREDLNPIEEAQGINAYMKQLTLTQAQAAEKLGKSRAAIANTLRLLNLPVQVQQLIIEGQLSMGHARALLGLDAQSDMLLLADKAIKQQLSVRQIEDIVRHTASSKQKTNAKKPSNSIYIQAIEQQLEDKFSTKISLSKKKLEINFANKDELNRILDLLGVDLN